MKTRTILFALTLALFAVESRAVVISQTEFNFEAAYSAPLQLFVGFRNDEPVEHGDELVEDSVFTFSPDPLEPWEVLIDIPAGEESGPVLVYKIAESTTTLFADSSNPAFSSFTARYVSGGLARICVTDNFLFGSVILPPVSPNHVITGYRLEVFGRLDFIYYDIDFFTIYTGRLTVLGMPDAGSSAGLLGLAVAGLVLAHKRFA
jgi:hypothetical protein